MISELLVVKELNQPVVVRTSNDRRVIGYGRQKKDGVWKIYYPLTVAPQPDGNLIMYKYETFSDVKVLCLEPIHVVSCLPLSEEMINFLDPSIVEAYGNYKEENDGLPIGDNKIYYKEEEPSVH